MVTQSSNTQAHSTSTGQKAKANQSKAQSSEPKVGTGKTVLSTDVPLQMKPSNLFADEAVSENRRLSDKTTLRQEAAQRIAQAKDMFGVSETQNREASEILSNVGLRLADAQTKGLFSSAEVTAIMGDQFGWKEKKDGGQSKTPLGQGEDLRKRIVRMVDAEAFLADPDRYNGSFFFLSDGTRMTPDMSFKDSDERDMSVRDVIAATKLPVDASGHWSIWKAYQALAKIKSAATVRAKPCFNVRTIAALADALIEDAPLSALIISENSALRKAYTTLIQNVILVGDTPPKKLSQDGGQEEASEQTNPADEIVVHSQTVQ